MSCSTLQMKLFRAGIKTTSRRFSTNCKITRSAAGHLVRQKALRLGVSLRIYYVTQQQHDTASAALLLPWGEFAGRGTREQFSDLHLFGTWSRPIDGVGEGFAKRAHSAQHTKYRRARVVSPTNNPGALTLNVPGARLYADDVTRAPCEMHDVFNNSSSV